MRKTLFIISCILLVSLSCQFLFPQQTQPPQAPLEEATVPGLLPEATLPAATQPEPAREQTPVPVKPGSGNPPPPEPGGMLLLEDLNLKFWNVRVSYNPAVWQPIAAGNEPPALAHQQLATCRLYEQGPTEPPQTQRDVTLGPVTYKIAEMESQGSPIHWYMAVQGPQGPFADGTPTLVVTSSAGEFEECRISAEEVLASMR